jgi:hypothetical protein
LAKNMRAYDALLEEREPLAAAQKIAFEALGELDTETPAQLQPKPTAFKALEFVISDKKLKAIQEKITDRENRFLGSILLNQLGLKGKQTEIVAINPEKRKIRAFTGEGNILTYVGGSYDSRKGKLTNLSLDPISGGFIELEGLGIIYKAGPLIERENDYQPLFEVKIG